MKHSRQLVGNTLLLTLGQVLNYGLSFLRNVILARTLAKADFGLAAVFGMTITLLEIAGRMSFGQQIIQAKDGASDDVLSCSHAFQFSLAMAGAILIASLSYPMACLFNVPHRMWSFSLLALIPFAKSFENLDYYRQQREQRYLSVVLCESVPQMIITLAAWPLVIWLGDFRVILWLMLGKSGMGILMTHLVAERSYRWSWRGDQMRRMWVFGWPLLLNGVLLFAAQQADQLVVGAFLSVAELASFALVMSVVSIPWFIFSQVASSVMLPILARVQDDAVDFSRKYRICVEYVAVGAILLMLPLIVGGEQAISLLFGAKYKGAGQLMALLGATSAVRFLRLLPTVAAMARADTLNNLIANIWRSTSLPLAVMIAVLGGNVVLIAACGLFAELVATAVSLLRLRRCQGVLLCESANAVAYVVGLVALGLGLVFLGIPRFGHWGAVGSLLSVLSGAVLAGMLVFPRVFRTLADVVQTMQMVAQKQFSRGRFDTRTRS
jgi:O-antigen/teichoic acid export membrane protein